MAIFDLPEKTPLQKLRERRRSSGRSLLKIAIAGAVVIGGFVAALDYSADHQIDAGNVAVAAMLGAATAAGTRTFTNQPGSEEALGLAVSALEEAGYQQERLVKVLEAHREFAANVQREQAQTRSQTAKLSADLSQMKQELAQTSSLLRELLSKEKGMAYQPTQPSADDAEFNADTDPWMQSLAEA